jgi:RND family efflux transporter MFP subunit
MMNVNRMKRFLWLMAKIAFASLIVAAVAYKLGFAPIPVEVHRVSRGMVTAEVMGTGTLEARVKTAVSSKIQGRLVELKADQNDWVKKGQLLATLDDSELKWQVEVAKASVETVHATWERLTAEEAKAKAVLEQARLDHDRTASLQSSGIVSQAEVDKSREQLKVAAADVKRAAAALIEAGKQEAAAERALRYQGALMENTRILSPFDGFIVSREREAGDVIVPGSAIFQLVSAQDIWVSAWVEESAMPDIASGLPARIIFRSEPSKEYYGTVARMGQQVDRDTREFVVDVRLKELPQRWAVGQRAEVYIAKGHKENVLTVPFRMIAWKEGKPGVYLNKDGRARWQPIKLGLKGLGAAEVTEGLLEGDALVFSRGTGPQPVELDGKRVNTS